MSEARLFVATTFTEIYDRVLVGPLFPPFAEQLVARVSPRANALKNLLVDAGFTDVSVETHAHDVRFAHGALFARLNAMAVIGITEKGKTMSEAERGELAGQIAAESQDVIARATKNGMFVFPLTTNIATARFQETLSRR